MAINTPTDLVNLALAHIGSTKVDSITDEKEPSEYGLIFWPLARQIFLQQSKIHKSRKEEALSLAAGETSNIYDYVYHYPNDIMMPIKIWDGGTSTEKVIYEIGTHSSLTSSVLKTDKESAVLIYCTDIVNLNVFNVLDILAMSYMLAILMVMPLKKEDELLIKLEVAYRIALSNAIVNDRNSQKLDVLDIENQFSWILDARKS
jgi:hypothetical protein